MNNKAQIQQTHKGKKRKVKAFRGQQVDLFFDHSQLYKLC